MKLYYLGSAHANLPFFTILPVPDSDGIVMNTAYCTYSTHELDNGLLPTFYFKARQHQFLEKVKLDCSLFVSSFNHPVVL